MPESPACETSDLPGYSASMSERNVETVRGFVTAANAGRVPADLLAPGFRMENRVSSVTDYEYHGEEGFQEWFRDVFEHFGKGARYELEEVLATGEDFVVASYCISGPGAFSEELIQFRWVGVTWLREGKATRAAGFPSRQEALRAVGRLD